jgi:hypothetical protein
MGLGKLILGVTVVGVATAVVVKVAREKDLVNKVKEGANLLVLKAVTVADEALTRFDDWSTSLVDTEADAPAHWSESEPVAKYEDPFKRFHGAMAHGTEESVR